MNLEIAIKIGGNYVIVPVKNFKEFEEILKNHRKITAGRPTNCDEKQ